jgi:hypothetical protein
MNTTTNAWISNNTFQISLFTSDTHSGMSGLEIGGILDKAILSNYNQIIYVSLKGINFLSPSFINGAFIYIIDLYGEDYFRNYIKVVEGKASLVKTISTQLKNYISQRQNFLENFAANKIYCGIDNSNEGIDLRYQLYELIKDKSRFLFNNNDGFFSKQTESAIASASSFIGFLTTENHHLQDNLFTEANYAIKLNKPTLFIVKKGIQVHVPTSIQDHVQIVYFDNKNHWELLRNINEIILNNKVKKDTSNEALAWVALGIGVVALIALLTKK